MTNSTPTSETRIPDLPSFRGYGPLVMAAFVFAFASYVTYGIVTMDVPESAATPGPKFYPTILVVALTQSASHRLAMNLATSPHWANTAATPASAPTLLTDGS